MELNNNLKNKEEENMVKPKEQVFTDYVNTWAKHENKSVEEILDMAIVKEMAADLGVEYQKDNTNKG